MTSGEVLLPQLEHRRRGAKRTYTAEAEWTFPPEFAELVWSDGNKVDRQVIDMTDMAPFSSHKFRIPFDADGKEVGAVSRCGIRRATAHSRSRFI